MGNRIPEVMTKQRVADRESLKNGRKHFIESFGASIK
jgi:hypothetical protein